MTKYGVLAKEYGSERLPNRVLESGAGWYIGTLDSEGFPNSRESVEYFPTQAAAETAFANGAWTQRDHP